jgi:hypothetical protein
MKVQVSNTIEVSDEQRVQLGAVLNGSLKPKRWGNRQEFKDLVWQEGQNWPHALADLYAELADPDTEKEPEEDLLGGDDEDLLGEDALEDLL